MLRKGVMGKKLILSQASDINYLVSCISAQEDRTDLIFSSKEPQLPFLYTIFEATYTLKCSKNELYAKISFWARRVT